MNPSVSAIQSSQELRNTVEKYLLAGKFTIKPLQRVIRMEWPCQPLNILGWLSNQKNERQMYWADRTGNFEVAGIGIAECISGSSTEDLAYQAVASHVHRYLSADYPNLRFYGGFSFDSGNLDSEWSSFGAYQLVIPRFELIRNHHQTLFACNLLASRSMEAQALKVVKELSLLKFDDSFLSLAKECKLIDRVDEPSMKDWQSRVSSLQKTFIKDHREKVVLARKTSLTCSSPISPFDILNKLKSRAPASYAFYFQPDPSSAFVSVSPECLYKREGHQLESEALAGTRPRGVNKEEDDSLRRNLLNSPKDNREHKYVVKAIRDSLWPWCTGIKAETAPRIVQLNGTQHLATRITARIKRKTSDGVLLKSLHPTPAVGGVPREDAMIVIRQTERFSRGWYAGPVGYFGWDQSEWAVGIRSALIKNKDILLYAGAGILEESNPTDEWKEIEYKIDNFLKIFSND